MMDVGRLRERITIRRQVNTKNAATGGLERSWSTVADRISAEVTNLNGREALIGNVLLGVSTFQITVRYRSDLKPSDQILWEGRELNIHAAEDRSGKRQWTVIIAGTDAPQGA